MKNWDYSNLSHEASINGGPGKYIEMIKETALQEGKTEGLFEGRIEGALGISAVGGLIYLLYKGGKELLKRRKEESRIAERKIVEMTEMDNKDISKDSSETME